MKKTNNKVKPITFTNNIPGFAESYPIIESTYLKREWVEKNASDLQKFKTETLKSCPMHMLKDELTKKGFIARCPGIREFMNAGYIVPLPCDIIIETNGDGITFRATDLAPKNDGSFRVVPHSKESFHDYTKVPLNTLQTVIKIATGWNFVPDERIVFLVINPFYNDEQRFTTISGIHDPLIDTQINPFLFWHALNGREVIKAGTPIAQYIPIPREFIAPPIICRTATEEDIKKNDAIFNIMHNSLSISYKDRRKEIIKSIYNAKF